LPTREPFPSPRKGKPKLIAAAEIAEEVVSVFPPLVAASWATAKVTTAPDAGTAGVCGVEVLPGHLTSLFQYGVDTCEEGCVLYLLDLLGRLGQHIGYETLDSALLSKVSLASLCLGFDSSKLS
jgi:hypothetical protein